MPCQRNDFNYPEKSKVPLTSFDHAVLQQNDGTTHCHINEYIYNVYATIKYICAYK